MDNTIKKILEYSINNKASDIHLTLGEEPVFRIHGRLCKNESFSPIKADDFNSITMTVLPDKFKEYLTLHSECDFSYTFNNEDDYSLMEYRFRGNLSYSSGNPMLVLRVISPCIRNIKELSLPEKLEEVAMSRHGLFIITGPTGSGKSTTLAALITTINAKRDAHIITIEDPVEYIFKSDKSLIHQKEIGTDADSFSGALRMAMRQDPDVIMIGELRDFETISAAITAAETGHLVLCTLHTPDAPQSIDRIVDVFPPYQQQQIRTQLSSVLIGVLSQQLIPAINGNGRVAATELLLANNAVKNYIRENKTAQLYHVIQTGSVNGMHLMDQNIARLYKNSLIDKEAAIKYAHNTKDLETFIRNE